MSEATVVDSGPASVSHDEATKAALIRDPEFMWAYVQDLQRALTAAESRIKELETESAKHYSMAVAMFYSGKVDDLTGPDCRKAAKAIESMLAQEAVEYPKCPSCGGRAGHWSDCARFPS